MKDQINIFYTSLLQRKSLQSDYQGEITYYLFVEVGFIYLQYIHSILGEGTLAQAIRVLYDIVVEDGLLGLLKIFTQE